MVRIQLWIVCFDIIFTFFMHNRIEIKRKEKYLQQTKKELSDIVLPFYYASEWNARPKNKSFNREAAKSKRECRKKKENTVKIKK